MAIEADTVVAPEKSDLNRAPNEAGRLKTEALNGARSWTAVGGYPEGPLPLKPYRSAEDFGLEREKVFKRAWLLMCHESELAEKQSFVVKDVEIVPASILITRDAEGVLRAFHNACSHRSNQLVSDRQGSAKALRCVYHSWTYRLDGTLTGVPASREFFNLDKKTCGLSRIALDTWNGWVFINLSKQPQTSLSEFLGEFGGYLQNLTYPDMSAPIVFSGEFRCHWRLLADATGESYHIGSIHPGTLSSRFASREDVAGTLIDVKFLSPHIAVSMFGDMGDDSQQPNRLEGLVSKIGTQAMSPESASAMATFLSHGAVNPRKVNKWSLDINAIFPNSQINTFLGGMITHQYWPISRTRTRYEGRLYLPRPNSFKDRIPRDYFAARTAEALLEDLVNVERSQLAIDQGGKEHMILQDNEIVLRHLYCELSRWMNDRAQ